MWRGFNIWSPRILCILWPPPPSVHAIHISGGDSEIRMSHRKRNNSPLFHFLGDILCPHPVLFVRIFGVFLCGHHMWMPPHISPPRSLSPSGFPSCASCTTAAAEMTSARCASPSWSTIPRRHYRYRSSRLQWQCWDGEKVSLYKRLSPYQMIFSARDPLLDQKTVTVAGMSL